MEFKGEMKSVLAPAGGRKLLQLISSCTAKTDPDSNMNQNPFSSYFVMFVMPLVLLLFCCKKFSN